MYIDSVIIYITAISFNLGEQSFAQGMMSNDEKQCMDTGRKGAKQGGYHMDMFTTHLMSPSLAVRVKPSD